MSEVGSPFGRLDVVVSHLKYRDFDMIRAMLPGAEFVVYDKSGTYPERCVRIPNVGREGYSYLTHIVDNYDSLADRTVFIQDDLLNHRPHLFAFAEEIKSASAEFHHFPCTWGGNGPVYRRTVVEGVCDLHTLGRPDAIKNACAEFSIQVPSIYTTETCAFFSATRGRIRSRTREFYRSLREWSVAEESREFVLEHIWTLIFR